ncbi:uncharacterized protein At5g41620-like [Telopea speciosissima]|uniref:uncharacterized protein At5g41620-like n=1 Tax=Telopea speciosissima TaxID=54955 RepID=UPI001CC7EB7B|nr:uncharacterized protein At5g41620-like [Telopea speciosissima]
MEREEKSGDGAAEKQEFLGIKLKRGILVGKRGGPCTPVPTWKFEGAQDTTIKDPLPLPPTVSARKLAANLWELHYLPLSEMSKGDLKLRRHKNKGLELPTHLADPSHSPPPAQPASASSLRRHVAASLMQHHQSIERNGRALQPLSPASYSSSLELAAYNPGPAFTPTSSLDLKGRLGEAGYSLKTSTELLKVLNRIWSLEEQHTSNITLVKALKIELDHARTQIKELLHEQQADQQEINELRKQVAESKVVRKSKEQDRIKLAVQSVRDELEDEKKLRKRSESLHRKLARELSEVKSAFSKALKELERERKARALLEDLCDEFARGIGDYDQEVRTLKHKSDKDCGGRDDPDRLVLHISEAWLDERMQMKLAEARCDLTEKNTMVDKLSSEIETFLQAKRSGSSKSNDVCPKDHKESCLRRHSLESVHLNEAVSAPKDAEDEKDSIGSDSHCFEINKSIKDKETNDLSRSNFEETGEDNREEMKSNPTKKKPGSREKIKGHDPSSLQLQFEQIARAVSCNGKTQFIDREQGKVGEDANPIETSISQKFENYEATQEDSRARRSKRDINHGSNLNHVIGDLIKSESLVEGGKFHLESNFREDSCGRTSWRGHASPVRQWMSRFTSPDLDIAESSSKWARGSKENTLKAKLLEARLEGQRSRLKSSKGSS